MVRKNAARDQASTAQKLSSIVKSCRDIMRKDRGLSSDVDRLPMLTSFMFLKFLDDKQKLKEAMATPRAPFRPWIEPPYRWRDWASVHGGTATGRLHLLTGEDLTRFVYDEEFKFPDGTKGSGLISSLRSLKGTSGKDERDVIASVYGDFHYRMVSGHLLREMLNKLDELNFTSTDEIHTLTHIYATMLKEMRDAAGDSGEFYTPRPVVKLMVRVIDPRLGEKVLDPACGTGGFLVEAFEHLRSQVKNTADIEVLQKSSLFGGEAKPLPYLLCQMNMLLHDIEDPNIDYGNSLRFPLHEIGDQDRVDVIMTNPPFGGEEEKGIQDNFPRDRRTSETALLFLQVIMRRLRRHDGRRSMCGVVVPNGVLFGDEGVCARTKEDLLRDFNLHTVVRLPNGVFAPYTGQGTNLLFFDNQGTTKTIWYYEHPLPPDRAALKNPCYTKTMPLVFEEFEPLLKWWKSREENDYAWKVDISEVIANKFNMDLRHPKHAGGQPIRTRSEVIASIKGNMDSLADSARKILELVNAEVNHGASGHSIQTLEQLGVTINPESTNPSVSFPDKTFRYVDLSSVSYNEFEGVKEILGTDAPVRARRVIHENDVIMSTVRPYLCGHAVVPAELDGEVCSTGFAVLKCPDELEPKFLYYMLISPQVVNQCIEYMRGAHYPALKNEHVQSIKIPRLLIETQRRIVRDLDEMLVELIPLQKAVEAFGQQVSSDVKRVFSSILSDVFQLTPDNDGPEE